MPKVTIIDLSNVPTDEGGYPAWEWPSKADHLLFDIGFSYALMREAESIIRALQIALGEHETAQPGSEAVNANRELRTRLGELVAKMTHFRKVRFDARDEIYEAGYVLGARFEAREAK